MSLSPPPDPRGLPPGYRFKPDWEITPRDTAERLRSSGTRVLLLDCRRREEWDTARIDGAVLIPMDQLERRADELEDDEGERSREIVVYCHHGVRSLRVAATLRALGFPNVKSMAGGIDAWSVGIDPGVPRY